MAETAQGPSFDEFYASTGPRLVRHGYALTGDITEAQDIAQEAFARAWQRWPAVRQCDSPEAWVRRVATNLAASRWRRIRVARAVAGHAAEQHAPEVSTDTVALVSGLRTLPERQRTVLVLHYMCDLSVDRIAAELDCPAGSVKSWLSRGRSALAAAVRVVEPDAPEHLDMPAQSVTAAEAGEAAQPTEAAAQPTTEPAAASPVTADQPTEAAQPEGTAPPATAAEPATQCELAAASQVVPPDLVAAPVLFAGADGFPAERLRSHSWPARQEPEASHA